MKPAKPIELEKPSERFKAAMKMILSVPKAELERREAEYKKARKNPPKSGSKTA